MPGPARRNRRPSQRIQPTTGPPMILSRAGHQPVRLAPRPVFLVGREALLADLHTRLTGNGAPWPRISVLHGLGGTGKTSLAVEYAHRHLAGLGVAWQFAAENPAVLTADFATLQAQLGIHDPSNAVASFMRCWPLIPRNGC